MEEMFKNIDLNNPVRLQIPLKEEDVLKLKLGDVVYLDGCVWTCRSLWHKRVIDQGVEPPIDIRNEYNVLMHCGPTIKQEGDKYTIVAAVPTASLRYATWTEKVLERFGPKAIIGKAGMQDYMAKQFAKHKAVYLLGVGNWIGAWYANRIKRVKEVHWLDMGLPEATWVFEAQEFGPFLVAIDTNGNSLYTDINKKIYQNVDILSKEIGHEIVMKRVGEVSITEEIL